MSKEERVQVLRRAQHAATYLRGAEVLWLDDNPPYNLSERRLFRSLGVFVDLARADREAWDLLGETTYDAIISDIRRGDDPQAGLSFLAELHRQKGGAGPPLIFYTAGVDYSRGTPPYAFGLTHRADHLLHYVIDAVERSRI